jgi:hypothetical protein
MDELLFFMARMRDDHRIGPTHISLYLALLGVRQELGASGVFPISRGELMERAKIGSRRVYYRCLRELAEGGYIGYEPEQFKGKRSKVRIIS